MKSLPLLVFTAFAACIPGTRASDHLVVPRIYNDPHRLMISNLSPTDQASYSAVDSATYQTVKKYNKAVFQYNIGQAINSLGLQIPSKAIASVFYKKGGASAYGQPISISDIFDVIGPSQLQGNAKLTKKIVSLVAIPPGEPNLLTTGDANANIVADPRGLLLLFREYENQKSKGKDEDEEAKRKNEDISDKSIDDLFKQNVNQFKYGLEIDDSWVDNGLLGWYAEGIPSRKYPIPITLSYDDAVALLCYSIFSSSTPPGSKARLTRIETAGIRQGILELLNQLKNRPTLETLSKLKTGPLKTDAVALDLRVGLKDCIAQRPSVFALLDSLVSLTENGTSEDATQMDILERFVTNVGLGAEDLFWMTHEKYSGISLWLFRAAVTAMCTDAQDHHDKYICQKSEYFLNAPGNGVLGWDTLSWVLRKMAERKLYSVIINMLSFLAEFSLLPAHALAEPETIQSTVKLLKSTKDGTELNASGKKKLEHLLSGKKPNKPQISKEREDAENGELPRRSWIGKMLGKLPGGKKP